MAVKSFKKKIVIADRCEGGPADGVTSHWLGEQLLVFSEPTQTLYSFNSTAAFIWLCLESGLTRQQTAAAIADTFKVGIDTASLDVDTILGTWHAVGLLRSGTAVAHKEQSADGDVPPFPEPAPYRGPLPSRFQRDLYFRLAGSTFLARLADEEYEAHVGPILAHLETANASPDVVLYVVNDDAGHYIIRDGLCTGVCTLLEQIGPILSQEALRCAYRRVNYLVAVHGAVVHDGSRCVILAGPSGIGKSTLTAALIKQGFGYYTDEVAILHRETLRVLPLQAGLRVKEGAWDVVAQLYPDFDRLPVYRVADGTRLRYLPPPRHALPCPHDAGLPVSALVFPRYAPGSGTKLSPMDRVDALHRLQDSGYEAGDKLDGERIRELLNWMQGVQCYEMTVDSLEEAVAAIRTVTA